MPAKKQTKAKTYTKYIPHSLLALSLLANAYQATPNLIKEKAQQPNKCDNYCIENYTNTYKVEKVIDGDTFIILGDISVRLAGLDAPEEGLCYSYSSKEYLKKMIEGKTVKLEEMTIGTYRRMIGLVYVDGILINEQILKNGYARYDSTGTTKDSILLEASHEAKDNNVGLYGYCTKTEPPNKDCVIKGNIEKHYGTKKYSMPGCTSYTSVVVEKDRGESWFCTEKEAIEAGYAKAGDCTK